MTDLKAALEGIGYRFKGDDAVFTPPNGILCAGDIERAALLNAHENREALMNAIVKNLTWGDEGFDSITFDTATDAATFEVIGAWNDGPLAGHFHGALGLTPCDALWNLWVQHHGLEAHMEAI